MSRIIRALTFIQIISLAVPALAGIPDGLSNEKLLENREIVEDIKSLVAAGLRFKTSRSVGIDGQKAGTGIDHAWSAFEFEPNNWRTNGARAYLYERVEGVVTIGGTMKAYITVDYTTGDDSYHSTLTTQLWKLTNVRTGPDQEATFEFADLKITRGATKYSDGSFRISDWDTYEVEEQKAIVDLLEAEGTSEELKDLLKSPKVSIYGRDYENEGDDIPLPHLLIKYGRLDLLRFLGEEAHLYFTQNIRTKKGVSLLSYAAKYLSEKDFLDYAEDAKEKDSYRYFPKMLRSRDENGDTAVFYAARAEEAPVAKIDWLRDQGLAFFEDSNNKGVKPLDQAVSAHNWEVNIAYPEAGIDLQQKLEEAIAWRAELEQRITAAQETMERLNAEAVIPPAQSLPITKAALEARGFNKNYALSVPFSNREFQRLQQEMGRRVARSVDQGGFVGPGNHRNLAMAMTDFIGHDRRWAIAYSRAPRDPEMLYEVIFLTVLMNPADYPDFPRKSVATHENMVNFYEKVKLPFMITGLKYSLQAAEKKVAGLRAALDE